MKITKLLWIFVVFALAITLIYVPQKSVFADFSTVAEGAAVLEVNTGKVLFEKNAHARLPMASTTKIMTALVALENADVNEVVKIDDRAVGIEGSSIYLTKGEILTVGELVYGLMLRSGNDCAVALAYHIAGGVDEFAELMNRRAMSLGLKNTNFVNPHGLHHDNHYTSAYDLAVISCAAMKNEFFKEVVGTKRIIIGKDDSARLLLNKNKLLTRMENATGIKTGFTKKAGRCFVGSAVKDGMEVVCVVLNCGPMFEETQAMLNHAFEKYEVVTLAPSNKLWTVINTNGKKTYLYSREHIRYVKAKDEPENIECKIYFDKDENGYILNVLEGKQLIFSRKLYTI